MSGYDTGDHLLRVEEASWWAPSLSIRTVYYGYHPPLGFMLAHAVESLGFTSVQAVQLVGTGASIAAFVFLRRLLAVLGLLTDRRGIFCLYFSAALPLVVHSGASVNQDIVIYAVSALALLWSVQIWREGPQLSKLRRSFLAALLLLLLVFAILVKFSGLLVCALPPLAAALLSRQSIRARLPGIAAACLLSVSAIGLAAPYYWQRYYLEEGTFFPVNDFYFYPEQLEEARAARDADLAGFFWRYLTPSILQDGDADPAQRDLAQVRLSQTWRDFWLKDNKLIAVDAEEQAEIGSASQQVGFLYWKIGGIAFLAGLAIWLYQWRRRGWSMTAWDNLGLVFFAYSLLLTAALTKFYYTDPLSQNAIAKGLYIMPVGWFIASVLSQLVERLSARWVVGSLLGWVLLNHLLPVY